MYHLSNETRMKEVIGELHILDTLHIVALSTSNDHKIVAGTYPNWIGDVAEEHR